MADWADEFFYLSPESSSIEGKWVSLPYQKAILNTIGNDDVRVVTWMKSARVGYTKCICVAVGYFAEHRKRNQVLYQPTDSDATDFVKDEIDTMLRDVAVLKGLLQSDPEKRSRHNTSTKKVFLGSTLDIKGGKTPRNYRRMTKDCAYYDELDGFDQDIENEGDPLSLGDTRLETSSYPKSVRGSTPKVKGVSQIEDSFNEADLQFRRHLPCPHCDHMQHLKWGNMKFEDHDHATTYYECEECQEAITYDRYAEMDQKGQWRSECGVTIDDNGTFRNPDGSHHPPVYHVGFHIWSAYSYFMTWSSMVKEFLVAKEDQKKGKLKKLKAFVNVRLGETWVEEGDSIDDHVLMRHREQYGDVLPDAVKVITCAVDVQDDRLEIEWVGWGEGEEQWGLLYKRIYGDVGKPTLWNILEEEINRSFEDKDGLKMSARLTCIDSGGHFTDQVYQFCARNRRKYIPIKGHSEMGKPIATMPKQPNRRGVYLVMVGTDTAKELLYERYGFANVGPGYCHYNDDEHGYDDEYFEQATAEVKIKRYRKGVAYFEWIKENSARNEALDVRVYNTAAVRLLQQHFGVRLTRPPAKTAEPELVEEQAPQETPAIELIRRQRSTRVRRKSGFTKGWNK
ncbi:phage terminase large subunit family protein [bacterium]|nr:phage terminase large subunit family protein [bacterium]